MCVCVIMLFFTQVDNGAKHELIFRPTAKYIDGLRLICSDVPHQQSFRAAQRFRWFPFIVCSRAIFRFRETPIGFVRRLISPESAMATAKKSLIIHDGISYEAAHELCALISWTLCCFLRFLLLVLYYALPLSSCVWAESASYIRAHRQQWLSFHALAIYSWSSSVHSDIV